MRHLGFLAGFCLGLFATGAVGQEQTEKPNVLFIAVDDLNDWVGRLGGHPQTRTPNIDRLADQGVLFTNAHCAAPACNPSRAAVMTGVAPYLSGVYLNSQPWKPPLEDKRTLPQHFMQHDYTAIGSGKIFHGRYPDPSSWHEYWPSKTQNRPEDPQPESESLSGLNKRQFDWGPLEVEDAEMGDTQVVDWVIGQLQAEHENPLFLACGIFRPHLPWYVPRHYFEKFPVDRIQLPAHRPDDLDDIPPAGVKMARPAGDHAAVLRHNQWYAAVQGYLASINYADAQVGRLLDALEESGFANNTVIVLWTDHGWHLGEKQHWRKFALWEEATRTPLIVVAPPGTPGLPEGTRAGTRIEAPVSLLDIYPTLIELCGLPARQGLSGQSLVPLLTDTNHEWNRPAITTHGRLNHAVCGDRWRYIRYADGSEELYDHASDPMEYVNLADRPGYDAVKEQLASWLPRENAPDAPLEGERVETEAKDQQPESKKKQAKEEEPKKEKSKKEETTEKETKPKVVTEKKPERKPTKKPAPEKPEPQDVKDKAPEKETSKKEQRESEKSEKPEAQQKKPETKDTKEQPSKTEETRKKRTEQDKTKQKPDTEDPEPKKGEKPEASQKKTETEDTKKTPSQSGETARKENKQKGNILAI